MHDTVNQLSRTLALANRFISVQLERCGLHGIAPSHGDILVQLFKRGKLPMSELAQLIDRNPSTVTTLVKKLVAEGYLSTTKQGNDKRVTLVSLTDEGWRLQPVFDDISTSLERAQCRNLDEHDLLALERMLHAMKESLEIALEGEAL